MNARFFVFPFLLTVLLGGGCASNVLVQDRVVTYSSDGNQEMVWKGKEARKKVSLKSLRVLVVDDTNTLNDSPYKEPLYLRMHTDYPMSKDSLIESVYYNRLLLAAFNEKLPRKADVRIFNREVSGEVLDSLVHADKIDVVITAKQIKFEYQCNHAGLSSFKKNIKPIGGGIVKGVIGTPSRQAGDIYAAGVGGSAFDFGTDRQPPMMTHTIIYHTEWDLQRIDISENKNEESILRIKQEGTLVDGLNYADIVFTSAARQAGESLAQIFNW